MKKYKTAPAPQEKIYKGFTLSSLIIFASVTAANYALNDAHCTPNKKIAPAKNGRRASGGETLTVLSE